jgi:hypothetical protein
MSLIAEYGPTLLQEYRNRCESAIDRTQVEKLWPTTCARLRDARQFKETGFILDDSDVRPLSVGGLQLNWVNEDAGANLIRAAGLGDAGVAARSYCSKRAAFMTNSVADMVELCSSELSFTSQFLSTIVWLRPERADAQFGNGSFYLAPHVAFVSDGTLFFIAPFCQIPREFGGYGLIENLYHEALHQQAHAHCALTQTHYCVDGINAFTELLEFPQRADRTFTLFRAINSYHVYRMLTPMRIRVLARLQERGCAAGTPDLTWLQTAASASFHMWTEFSDALTAVVDKFVAPWDGLIRQWARDAREFGAAHPTLAKAMPPVLVE